MDAESNRALIRSLYEALDRHDGDAMAACYLPDARFRDPAFGELSGREAGQMWRMLTSRADDLSVELVEHDADDAGGSARWVARYTFTQTGRSVRNDVRASFRFRDGLIAEHVDRFPLWTWSRQALGLPGLVLGWTPLMGVMLRRQARSQLARFAAGG